MLAKSKLLHPQITAKARTLDDAYRKMNRALREFRVRGVKTNIPFILNVIEHPKFLSAAANTRFIDEEPKLFNLPKSQNRANRLLNFLGNVVINGPATQLVTDIPASHDMYPTPKTPPGK